MDHQSAPPSAPSGPAAVSSDSMSPAVSSSVNGSVSPVAQTSSDIQNKNQVRNETPGVDHVTSSASSISAMSGYSNSNSNSNSNFSNGTSTLWMGELENWYDENTILTIWAQVNQHNVTVKMIPDKLNGANAGYCFVDFGSPHVAEAVLNQLNGQPMPVNVAGPGKVFRLNWASGGGINDKRDDRSPEFSIFVGDLSPDVTEQSLYQIFQARYPSCKSARIMTDPNTNASRGYGFVRFSDESQMHHALGEMQGFFIGSRPIRISTATPKTKYYQQQQQQQSLQQSHQQQRGMGLQSSQGRIPAGPGMSDNGGVYYSPNQALNQFNDPHNTTVFIGGLSSSVTDEELRYYFQGFGDIIYVKIPPGKGCGFVQYVQRQSAENAIAQMQGYPIANSRIRLSWGRSQHQLQQQQLQAQAAQVQAQQAAALQGQYASPNMAQYQANGHVDQQHQYQYHANGSYPQGAYSMNPQYGMYSNVPPMHHVTMSTQAQAQAAQAQAAQAQAIQSQLQAQIQNQNQNDSSPVSASASVSGSGSTPAPGTTNSEATAAPGATTESGDPVPVARLNELYLAARDGRLDRLEIDGRGYHGVYAQ